jgi:putative ABC transport system ATP-binding protein
MTLKAKNISKSHHQAQNVIQVLNQLNLDVKAGESVAIVGKSGSGKSTLLSLLSGLDQPDSGEIWFGEEQITHLNETQLSQVRAHKMGIIFQQFQLVQTLTALENVMLPLDILRRPQSRQEAEKLLTAVGLSHRMDHFPNQLSGGEQQRVAIARAMAAKPQVILADEPTGNLDEDTGKTVMEMIFKLTKLNNTSLILVTHDQELAQLCERTLHLQHGVLVE